jgi:hypothetical protein
VESGLLQLPDQREDLFAVADMPSRLVFGVDQSPVDDDVEDAAVARDLLGPDTEYRLEGGRQTGGQGVVVSDLAEGNGDLHDHLGLGFRTRRTTGGRRLDG